MASAGAEPPAGPQDASAADSKALSKKQAKKLAKKKAKDDRRQQDAAAAAQERPGDADPLAGNYGDSPPAEIQSEAVSGLEWTEIGALGADRAVLLRGASQAIRPVSKKMAFLVLRQAMSTVHCVLTINDKFVTPQMVKFATGLSKESIVDIEGIVSIPKDPVTGTTQQVEVQVRKIDCINRAVPRLPINIEDASRIETESEKAEYPVEQLGGVGLDTSLNYRVLDLRASANHAIFRIQCHVEDVFRRFLRSEGFVGIHTPKLVAGTSEGGAAVFKLEYKGQPACLAQSLQLHEQMVICGGFGHVFEVGSVFRAEDSYTRRHLCEFVGLDVEMEIKEHYFEYLRKTLRLTFREGIRMLEEAGIEVDPLGDLNTEAERELGRLVREKYGTDPLAGRPFYIMPCYDGPAYSNSFDVFIRGKEIISGAQRVHMPELLTAQAEARKIDVNTISSYN